VTTSKPDPAKRLIIALDVNTYDSAAALIELLAPHVGWFKLGSVLFTREGPRVCKLVKDSGAKLFLDLKYHDIPNTVHGAVSSAAALQADMITLHTSGGEAMMRAAVTARDEAKRNDMVIVGVTVLTHLNLADFQSLFASEREPRQTILALAETAKRSGLDGVVASAKELPIIKRRLGQDFTVVTPGIRPADSSKDDQTRVVTPAQAVADGADYLVVGRPVYGADDPADACRRIVDEMRAATVE
jgi:orotidine-5'-phosphate decarboxylase